MEGSVSLGRGERKRLLEWYRGHSDPAVRLRAHIVLLLADGRSWMLISTLLFCSTRTIARWKRRYDSGGVEALKVERRGRRSWVSILVLHTIVEWVTCRLPRDFGFLRSRWSCETLAVLTLETFHEKVSPETVRRWLHREQLVWRRPRPVLEPQDPDREKILRNLRELLAKLPANEIAVFQDEVDVNTNPKIGSMWMPKGEQAEVPTPGNNEKRYLAGSLNWRTGDLILTEGLPRQGRNTTLFLSHLEELRSRLRCYRKIHVICDSAIFHKSQRVQKYLATWGHRLELHFLPKYSPDANPIERVWWHLHEEITRNHRCQSMEELLDLVFDWLEHRTPFVVERDVYLPSKAA